MNRTQIIWDSEARYREGEAPAEPLSRCVFPPRGSAGASPSRGIALSTVALGLDLQNPSNNPLRGVIMNESNSELPQRKHPAHGVQYVEGQPTIIFDTICTKDRNPWLANEDIHQCLRQVWADASAWLVGRYIIMPDHIHMFAALTKDEIEYKNWVQYWKSQFTKRHKVAVHRWQVDNWDTRIRTGRQYEEKWDYVRMNAVRHKLVERAEDWPYQGVMNELRWEQW